MAMTPWGEAGDLRSRRLPPGPGTPAEEVERNHRERLYAALVATVAEKGYEKTRVRDLVELSGVSHGAFYRLFDGKQECLVEACGAVIAMALQVTAGAARESEDGGLAAFVELLLSQPAAAQTCFVECYAAGPEALVEIERRVGPFEDLVGASLAANDGGKPLPVAMRRAILGGWIKVIQTRIYREETEELRELAPQLWSWATSYSPPPEELRVARRRSGGAGGTGGGDGEEPVERLLRALAEIVTERGYPEMTVASLVERASTSQRTFYQHFKGREEAMLAAFDAGSARMMAAILPAYRRGRDWPDQVRGGIEAMLAFAAREPEFTLLGVIGSYAAGQKALEARDNFMAGLALLLAPGYESAPEVPEVVAEAIGGTIYALTYDQVREGGAESLREVGPLMVYMALAPFLGAEEACRVANGG